MKSLTIYLLLLLSISLFIKIELTAQSISNSVQDKIDEFMQLRMELAACTTNEEALEQVVQFKNTNTSFIEKCSQEEALILKNFILLEEYNYINYICNMNGDSEKLDALFKKIENQKNINEEWIKKHSSEGINKWLYATAADVTACYMSMVSSISATVKYGLTVKDYYEKAVAQDNNFSYALVNLGQWNFFAPSVAGGGKSKARKYLERAITSARNSAELYFAKIYYSQLLFEQHDKGSSKNVLAEAESYFPSGSFVPRIRNMNSKGVSLFDYQLNNSAVQPETN